MSDLAGCVIRGGHGGVEWGKKRQAMQPDVMNVQLTLHGPILAGPGNAAARRANPSKEGPVHAVGLETKWLE